MKGTEIVAWRKFSFIDLDAMKQEEEEEDISRMIEEMFAIFHHTRVPEKKNLINLEEGNNFMIKYQHLRHYILLVIFDWRSLLALLPLSKSMNPLSLRRYCHRDVIHTFDFHCSFKHAYRVSIKKNCQWCKWWREDPI